MADTGKQGSGHSSGQGTGKHPHKSSQDPHEHHEAESQKGGSKQSSASHGSGQHGSGQHKSEQKSEHHESSQHGREGERSSHGGLGRESSSESDLKSREYKDAQGNVHHHTHTSGAQQHKGSGDKH